MTCPKESQHAEFAHVDLGEGEWAHLKRKPNYEESQRIQIAELAADYQTAGTARDTELMIRTVLTGAPAEWREGYTDKDGTVHEPQFEPTMRLVHLFLDQYETKIETVLLGPETRQKMAKATVDFYATLARVYFHEGSWGTEWPPSDATAGEIVEQKALGLWRSWRREVNERLKAVGSDSD